ncbi:hypothetical protein [Streptomyces sp. CBMAI 2042]|nr:hypothetical protein [Streptomyces sp. CBMAI 2042]RLV64754.1 thioredoxin-disulfide reductase [Streptomyces sp. CBMAI 2042]
MSQIREVVIIGSGPASYTTAPSDARAQQKPLLFDSSLFLATR